MGNKIGTQKNKNVDIKIMPLIKQHLSKLETQIFPNQNLHYILLDSDFDTVLANSTWSELSLTQREVHSIFSKLKLTAMQFAQTLDETETRCIHLKGEKNLFSYYAIKEYRLVIHRNINKLKENENLHTLKTIQEGNEKKIDLQKATQSNNNDGLQSEQMDSFISTLSDILYGKSESNDGKMTDRSHYRE